MEHKFKVEFLESVMKFLESLDQKSREKNTLQYLEIKKCK